RVVAHMNDHIFALHETKQRPWNLLVDHHAVCGATSDADFRVVDYEVVFPSERRRVRHKDEGDGTEYRCVTHAALAHLAVRDVNTRMANVSLTDPALMHLPTTGRSIARIQRILMRPVDSAHAPRRAWPDRPAPRRLLA